MNSRVFIASSSGALPFAHQLAALLKNNPGIQPTVWDEKGAVFELSKAYIESLVDALDEFDFAVMLFHPDDRGEIKGKKVATTRDNVVFEYGLFIGKLGRDRCYVIQPENIDLRIPSDLLGVHNATYVHKTTTDPEEVKKLMVPAANLILGRINEINQKKKAGPTNIQVIGSHLHLGTTQLQIFTQLEECIRDGITLPEEILYWSVESANAWLDYEQETFQNANGAIGLMARFIDKNNPGVPINLISLGCGSGAKDVLMLNMLSPQQRMLHYIPVGQSYTLLEKAIGEALSNNAENFMVNGIRADFRQLPSLKHLFHKKGVKNIYSLLGCTLGNYDEVGLLNSITTCMEEDDYLLLEIGALSEELKNKKNGETMGSGKYADHKLQRFLLSPAKNFVASIQNDALWFIVDNENITVPNSVRVIVKFDNKTLPNQNPFDIAYSTHYQEEDLVQFLLDFHELQTIHQDTKKGNIYLVCRKGH